MRIPTIAFNRFYNYADLKEQLYALAAAAPELCKLKVIGKSWQGRDIIALEITDYNVGIPEHKTGYYADACTHAEEFCGSNVLLYLSWYLLENHGKKAEVTQLLADTIFYIIPRLNPDGVETALSNFPWIGNGRYRTNEIQPKDGLYTADVDGNGVVLQMRVPDPAGEWKVSEHDPRIMEVRKPFETGGTYYRVYPEGYVRGEVIGFPIPKPRDGNLNRNYPAKWTPDPMQYGGSELPLVEPEVRAVTEYILARPNIGGVQACHTNAGVILRPFSDKEDRHFAGADLQIYEQLGAIGTEELGYPVISTFNGFTTDKNQIRGGTIKDWTYDHLGLPCFITEFWNVFDEMGLTDIGHYQLGGTGGKLDADVLKWIEPKLDVPAFYDWTEVEHPQLGKVEVGGFNRIFIYRNPPSCMLEPMAKKGAMFTMKLAQALPKLKITDVQRTELAPGIYHLRATVKNSGYLPTYLTSQAIAAGAAQPVALTLGSESAFEVLCATHPTDVGHLAGRFGRNCEWSPWIPAWQATERAVEWVVRTDCPDAQFDIVAGSPRTGTAKARV